MEKYVTQPVELVGDRLLRTRSQSGAIGALLTLRRHRL